MDIIHIQEQITEYILDLLPAEERQVVARHIAGCDMCQRAVQQEREIGRLVHQTLNVAARPDYNRIQSLRPPLPSRRSSILALLLPRIAPYRQWTVACLLLVAMMGAFLFGSDGRFNNLAQPLDGSEATLSSLNHPATAEALSTIEAGTFYTITAPESVQSAASAVARPQTNNPLAVPQVTPAPEATYFQ